MADKKGGKKEATAEDIMSPADMKMVLASAKRGNPASCAIALTKDKDGVILLDRKKKPKQLSAMLKKEAASAGLVLDMPSIRFGRAVIPEDDSAQVNFVVNKDASGAMRPKLLVLLKKAGYQKLEIGIDSALEQESEEEESEAPPEAPQAARAPAAEPAAEPAQAAAPAAEPESDAASVTAADASADTAESEDAAPAAENPIAALVKRMADLIKQIPVALSQAPDQKEGLLKLAGVAAAAVKQPSDPDAATHAVDALENAIKSASQAAAPAAAPAAASATAAAPAAEAAASNGKPAAAATISKSSLAWGATRKAVEGQINALHSKMTEAYKDHGFGADLDKFFKSKVDPVLEKLDSRLSEILDEAGKATEAAQQKELMTEAQKVISSYEGYLAGEPLIKQLDKNPFAELKIEETLTKTLATLNKSITNIVNTLHV
ncbi:MAG TPA: hypothetical protein VGC16_01715 [Rhizomicrobium sp.]